MEHRISTSKKVELLEVTEYVREVVSQSDVEDGYVLVFCPHTTAAITVNENADPDVKGDMIASLSDIVRDVGFSHSEGNSDAHVKSSLIGCSEQIPVVDGELVLGTWQGIYFCEFDGPRDRRYYVNVCGA